MKYEGMIFRPPSEAESLILQVTVGCSYNRCTFCGAYQGKRFRIKSFEEIKEDIDEVSVYQIRRVFLADGDALIIPQKEMLQILSYLRKRLRGLERVGIYAYAKDILRKEVEELKALKDLGLGIIYLGLESGDPAILKRIKRNATVDQLIRAGKTVKESGILLSVTVILGLGGVEVARPMPKRREGYFRKWTRTMRGPCSICGKRCGKTTASLNNGFIYSKNIAHRSNNSAVQRRFS